MARRIPAGIATDCRSLFDLLRKPGSLPQERRVALDILDLRDGIENEGLAVRWVPTNHMASDCLTKLEADPAVQHHMMRTGRYSFRFNEDIGVARAKAKDQWKARRAARKVVTTAVVHILRRCGLRT